VRDPRIDPMPGDVVRAKRTRRVMTVAKSHLGNYPSALIFEGTCGYSTRGVISLSQWRKWAANAEVIERGDDAK